ncbi:MAG TPA: hypothetical protein DCR14_09820, partial [Acidimicrobiaceae bacterium]|nr:hypothetical protein [Acidimicrobiaceae bacterium]
MSSRLSVVRRSIALLAVAALAAACSDESGKGATTSATEVADTVAPTSSSAPDTVVDTVPTTDPAPTSTDAPGGTYDFSEVAAIVEQFVADNGLNGAGLVIVDREDGIVGEVYVGEFSADRVSLIASSSKMLTAGVLLRLQDQGVLDLNTPIGELVPWAGDHPDITLAQMMSSSSGLVGLLPNPGYSPYVCQFIGTEMEACAAEVLATDADDADVVPPDTEFRYGGVQWQIAGAVAETVTGKTWAELLDETYLQPCGVDSLGYNNHWVPLGGGSFDYPQNFDPSQLPPTE